MKIESGELSLNARELRYVVGGAEVWRIRIDDLRLIAEYTNEGGPGLDDYFYVFVVGKPWKFHEAPMYAGPHILGEVASLLGIELTAGLAHSTTFKSRVIWPPALADRPLWTYTDISHGHGVWSWIKDRFGPLIRSELTEEVRTYLGDAENASHPA